MVSYCGRLGTKHFSKYLSVIREELQKSNLRMVYEIYVGKMILFSIIAFLLSFSFVTIMFTYFGTPILFSIVGALIVGTGMAFAVLTIYHSYPFHFMTSKRNSIEGNMPFVMNHMGAIASSGVPPFIIFKLIANVPEYGEIVNESKRIVRNVDLFGMDITSAIKNVADRTPSQDFRQFLYGIVSTIETGGDLVGYFENSAKEALSDYKMKREKYMQTLSTYADFYTAVLIAAPLFFVSTLSILSLLGGQIFGLDIPTAIKLGVYVLMPLLNTVFIMFIHYTQPSIS
jgi:archaeal flagellar protein FlaJ